MPLGQQHSARPWLAAAAAYPAGCVMAIALVLASPRVLAADDAPRFSLPVACDIGRTCYVQQYPDVAATASARDFTCGPATYDGHKGIDIRVRSLRAIRSSVAVLAAADGVVKAVRDGMADRLIASPQSRATISGRECGNGVVIDHGGGWTSQLCHLRRGSITVRRGARVRRGQPIGAVGASGLAQFAHVHFDVRKNGEPYSTFLGRPLAAGCASDATDLAPGLWTRAAYAALMPADAQLIELSFSDRTVAPAMAERGGLPVPKPRSKAFVLFARAINLRPGDRLRLRLAGPNGLRADHETQPVRRSKAHYVAYTGKKLTAARWPRGRYHGVAKIIRRGDVLRERNATLQID